MTRVGGERRAPGSRKQSKGLVVLKAERVMAPRDEAVSLRSEVETTRRRMTATVNCLKEVQSLLEGSMFDNKEEVLVGLERAVRLLEVWAFTDEEIRQKGAGGGE